MNLGSLGTRRWYWRYRDFGFRYPIKQGHLRNFERNSGSPCRCRTTYLGDHWPKIFLEQLETLWKKNDWDGGTLSRDLDTVISSCAFDLDHFREKISRLRASLDEKIWKTWRNLKSVLEKGKLQSIRMVILQHHSALEGYLALSN